MLLFIILRFLSCFASNKKFFLFFFLFLFFGWPICRWNTFFLAFALSYVSTYIYTNVYKPPRKGIEIEERLSWNFHHKIQELCYLRSSPNWAQNIYSFRSSFVRSFLHSFEYTQHFLFNSDDTYVIHSSIDCWNSAETSIVLETTK